MANKRGEKSGMTLYWIAEVHTPTTQLTTTLGFPAELFRPRKSWEGPGRDRTRPRDPEVPGTKKSRD